MTKTQVVFETCTVFFCPCSNCLDKPKAAQVCYFKTDHPGVMLPLLKKVPRDQDHTAHFCSSLKFQISRAPPQSPHLPSISSLCYFIGRTLKNIDCKKSLPLCLIILPGTLQYLPPKSFSNVEFCLQGHISLRSRLEKLVPLIKQLILEIWKKMIPGTFLQVLILCYLWWFGNNYFV